MRICLRNLVAMSLGLCTVALIAAAGCRSSPVRVGSSGFVGSLACAPCHPNESTSHSGSAHSFTMRAVDRRSMGENLPKPGPLQGSNLSIFQTQSGIALGFGDNPKGAVPLTLALGSEHFAFTFVNVSDPNGLFELRTTYFPQRKEWRRTPGQQGIERGSLGLKYNQEVSRHCLGCHATALPAEGITPEPRFYGVGCESCHGPGQKHIDSVRALSRDMHIVSLRNASSSEILKVCGRCHRSADMILPAQEDMTHRFQTYGLQKSRCFTRSRKDLSCITCHDPHQKASTDHRAYEKTCLTCHAPAQGFGPVNLQRKPCPVNPRSGCVPCHMPKRIIDKSILPIEMADHYIRVWRDGEPDRN